MRRLLNIRRSVVRRGMIGVFKDDGGMFVKAIEVVIFIF